MVSSLAAVLAFASAVAALSVTSPTKSDVWTVGEDQTVTWDSVSTDQDTFNIYLSNMASYPSTTILLAEDVDSSAGSQSIDGSKLTAGDSFTINFTNGTETEQIYAQSNQFNITEGSSSSSTSASASSTASATSTGSSSSGTATATTTLATATTGAPGPAASSASANSSSNGTASGTATSASSGSSSSATGSSTASGSAASSTSTTASTSDAGHVVAGWMGVVAAVAALTL